MRCDVQLYWRSGKGKIYTKNPIRLMGSENYFDVNEKLSIMGKVIL
jgi:hypothetical protein